MGTNIVKNLNYIKKKIVIVQSLHCFIATNLVKKNHNTK